MAGTTFMEEKVSLNVKYYNLELPRLEKTEKGDWIDVRINSITCMMHNGEHFEKETAPIRLKKNTPFYYDPFDFLMLHLGFALQLPEGYEADLRPRSSTFKNFGFIQVNSAGIIDCSYRGDDDEWMMPVLSLFPGSVFWGDRVGQFRIQRNSPGIDFIELTGFDTQARGGFGSTGKR